MGKGGVREGSCDRHGATTTGEFSGVMTSCCKTRPLWAGRLYGRVVRSGGGHAGEMGGGAKTDWGPKLGEQKVSRESTASMVAATATVGLKLRLWPLGGGAGRAGGCGLSLKREERKRIRSVKSLRVPTRPPFCLRPFTVGRGGGAKRAGLGQGAWEGGSWTPLVT